MQKKRAVVAITGASGAVIGIRLLKILLSADVDIFCIVSDAAKKIIPEELNERDAQAALRAACPPHESRKISSVKFYDERDFFSPPASGSFRFDAMAVAPCSMKTLGKIAGGIADNLIVRAAEVALKERRALVVCPRETPLALTHLRNMCALSEAGAVILPPVLSYYNNPKTPADMADFCAARIAQSMGFEQNVVREWGL